jgi:hypothetical protein
MLDMEPLGAAQVVLTSDLQVMGQGEPQSHCRTQQADETQCFGSMFITFRWAPKAPGSSGQDRHYYLGSRQLPVRSETLIVAG